VIASWKLDRALIEREVCRPSYAPLLATLQERVPEVADLSSWPTLVASVQERGVRGPDADGVLRTLVKLHAESRDNKSATILLLLCMTELGKLHRARRRWMPGQARRWRHIRYCFLRALHRLDPAQRPRRLGQKLLNDTARGFYDDCVREWARNARFETVDPATLDETCGAEDAAFDVIELRHTSNRAARRVRSATAAGAICFRDSYLVLGTRIYGMRLHAAAEKLGIGYEAAKKRRQRAESKLRRRKS
jgi:hypothetical protein